jgi:hypothetical protein
LHRGENADRCEFSIRFQRLRKESTQVSRRYIMKLKNTSLAVKFLCGVVAVGGVAAVVSSCGGGGGSDEPGPTAGPTAIDTASVNKAITDFGATIAICKDGATGALRSGRGSGLAAPILAGSKLIARVPQVRPDARALGLGGTPPADTLGNCGGRWGYRDYTHSAGITNATLAFENYCQKDIDTGVTWTINGRIGFVNTATPTDSGPITTKVTASSTAPLTTVAKDASGATVSSQTINFSGFKLDVGVPGGIPSSAKPDVLALDEMTVKNEVTGKTYRQTGYSVTEYETAAGETVFTLTGRGYRSDGTYFDISTPVPVAEDVNGNLLRGQMKVAGANGSNAVATMVPGPTMQATLTVNGAPVTSVPNCRK